MDESNVDFLLQKLEVVASKKGKSCDELSGLEFPHFRF
jgi:hypothetical protein